LLFPDGPGVDHRDSLLERRVVLEQQIGPGRRARVGDVGLGERDEELARRLRVVGGLQRLPVRLGFHAAGDPRLGGRGGELERDDDEQPERDRLGPSHATATARRAGDEIRPGQREQRVPGEALREVVARVVSELVCHHDVDDAVRVAPVEQRVPENDPARRAEPHRVGVHLVGLVADVLDPDRDVRQPLRALVRACVGEQRRVAQRVRAERDEVRNRELEPGADRDEDKRARQPPHLRQLLGDRHHDHECEADGEERRAQLCPVAGGPREVPLAGRVVAAIPPMLRDAERQVAEPDQREAEHAEEHPGADRAGCRLPGERRTALCVEGEDAERCDLRREPVPVPEALVARCAPDRGCSERRCRIDVPQLETPGHRRAEEEGGRNRPADCRDRKADKAASGQVADPGVKFSASCSGSGGNPWSVGAAYG
jgi:hypothetical protein